MEYRYCKCCKPMRGAPSGCRGCCYRCSMDRMTRRWISFAVLFLFLIAAGVSIWFIRTSNNDYLRQLTSGIIDGATKKLGRWQRSPWRNSCRLLPSPWSWPPAL